MSGDTIWVLSCYNFGLLCLGEERGYTRIWEVDPTKEEEGRVGVKRDLDVSTLPDSSSGRRWVLRRVGEEKETQGSSVPRGTTVVDGAPDRKPRLETYDPIQVRRGTDRVPVGDVPSGPTSHNPDHQVETRDPETSVTE